MTRVHRNTATKLADCSVSSIVRHVENSTTVTGSSHGCSGSVDGAGGSVVEGGTVVEGGAVGLIDERADVAEGVANVNSDRAPSRHVTSALSVGRLKLAARATASQQHSRDAEHERCDTEHVIEGHLAAATSKSR